MSVYEVTGRNMPVHLFMLPNFLRWSSATQASSRHLAGALEHISDHIPALSHPLSSSSTFKVADDPPKKNDIFG